MAMLDRRWLPAALLGGAGLLGWLSAMGANAGLSRWLALPEDAELTDLSGATAPASPDAPGPEQPDGAEPGPDANPDGQPFEAPSGELSRSDWVDPIVRRNIFDSAAVGQPSKDNGDISGEGRRTDLKVVLMATIVAMPEIYSSALIAGEDRSARATGYGIGDDLMGEATIVKIEQKKVFLRRSDGTVEYLDMENKAADAPRDDSGPATDSSVASSGDNKFTVDRSLLESTMANPEALAGQVRVVPHKGADGEIDGYRLSGIRKGSVFEQLGIKNGDIVHTVNGKALTSTSNAMDAYSSLQNERSFSFEITRRSKRQTMEYEVR